MVERDDNRITRTSSMNTWRAGCGESRTSGSEGGPEKPTRRKSNRALRLDPYSLIHTGHITLRAEPDGTLTITTAEGTMTTGPPRHDAA